MFRIREACSEVWESLLLRLLGGHFDRKFRRVWGRRGELPHFFDHRKTLFDFAYGKVPRPVHLLARAYYTAELLRPFDQVLDIGCGDGFLTARYYSPLCGKIDALDIDVPAIEAARRKHSVPNVRFFLCDAVAEPFPQPSYDVIAWDGALGHFAPDTTALMMAKIAHALTADGVFVGSESLGREGHDHLQFFEQADDLQEVLKQHFREVRTKTLTYTITGGIVRREIYWRCSQNPARLTGVEWDRLTRSAETI